MLSIQELENLYERLAAKGTKLFACAKCRFRKRSYNHSHPPKCHIHRILITSPYGFCSACKADKCMVCGGDKPQANANSN